jgi:chloride channel 3/4/5
MPEDGQSRTPGPSGGTERWDKMDRYDPLTTEFHGEGTGRRVAYNDFSTIDWIHDTTKERVRQRKLRSLSGLPGLYKRALDVSQGWIVVTLIGLLTGILAGYINISSEWLSDLKLGVCREGYYLNEKFCCWLADGDECSDWRSWSESLFSLPTNGYLGWWIDYAFFIFWATLFGIVSGLLVKNYAPYAAGSGIPEVKTILGGFVIRKFLGFWTLIIKCIGLALSVASGMALGKEGPLVHVACSLGNIIPRIFQKYATNEAKKREILSAASAAGVSVAFGAPIGGVLFSLEEVSYYFPYKTMWRSFFCAMVAALSLQLVNPFRTGKLVLFQVEYKRNWHVFELPFFILLGILGGLYGAMFIKLNLRYAALRKRSWLREWPLHEVGTIALVTAILSYPFHFARSNSSLIVANLFKECEEVETDFHGLCKYVPV